MQPFLFFTNPTIFADERLFFTNPIIFADEQKNYTTFIWIFAELEFITNGINSTPGAK